MAEIADQVFELCVLNMRSGDAWREGRFRR